MTVSKTDNGRWRVRVKSGRQAVASRTFDLKRDAEAWESAQKRALSLGDFVDPRAGKEPLGSVVDRWLVQREGTVASTTLKADRALILNLSTTLRNRPISAVTPADLDVAFSDLLKRGLARSSVVRYRAVLSSAFTWATRAKLVVRNPVRETKVPAGQGIGKAREVFPLTVEELREIVTELVTRSQELSEVALVLGLTGLRWGELVALRVRDVVVVPIPALRVTRSAPDGHAVRNRTKGGGARTVPLTAELVPILGARIQGKHPDDLVFTSEEGHRLNGSNWRRAVDWSALGRGRRIHDLRHTAATFWLTNGIDPKTVQTWLGHASMTLTVDLYSHWMGSGADAAAISQVDQLLGGRRGDTTPNLRATGTEGEGQDPRDLRRVEGSHLRESNSRPIHYE
jgi:integrase